MISRHFLVAVLAGAVSGCGPIVPPDATQSVETSSEAIVGGITTSGDPAVVMLLVNGQGGYSEYCTGTLIAPKTVLTAAHCINAYGAGNFYAVGVGASSSSPQRVVQTAQQVRHPSYGGNAWDFGVLRLAQPITDVAPIPLNESALTAADVGKPIRHVGFGITNPSGAGSGVKREVTYNLRQVSRYTIESGANGKQTCQGDSGGPGFMTIGGVEKVVGVVSYGDQNCAYEGWDGRVDVAAQWIRTTMAAWETPTCATDGACVQGCTPVDQDCVCVADGTCSAQCTDLLKDPDCPRDCVANGVCALQACPKADPDCIAEGGFCQTSMQCKGRLCITDSQNSQAYCSKSCQQSSECASGMECAQGSCLFVQKPERHLFDPCSKTDFCIDSICNGPADGITRCVKSCIASSDCPSGSQCEAGADARRYCRPANLRFTPLLLTHAGTIDSPAQAGCSSVSGMPMLSLGLIVLTALRRRKPSP